MFGFRVPVRGDLHMHSHFSDGIHSPEEMVREARARSLAVIALTDHDTMAGFAAARAEGARIGVEVLPGVEMSVRFAGREVHLLAYGLDPSRPAVAARFAAFTAARWSRIARMVGKLVDLGVPVTVQEVRAQMLDAGSLPCRPHLARALERAGHVRTAAESFERYIGDTGPAYVGFEHDADAGEAIRFVGSEGGVAVLAHPFLSRAADLLPALADLGLDGVETRHPEQDAAAERELIAFCRDRGLIATAGSDAHDIASVGRAACDAATLHALTDRIESRRGRI